MIALRERLPQLDGLRGLAILLVIVWHVVCWTPAVPHSPLAVTRRLLGLTWSGVDLFFVLSGFLLGAQLIDKRGEANYFSSFYIRRFFRIVPLYMVIVLILGSVLFALGLEGPDNEGGIGMMPGWGWYVTFTQNVWMAWGRDWSLWHPMTWSLAIEEQFYLFLPLIIFLAPVNRLRMLLVIGICAAPLLRTASWLAFPNAGTLAHVSLFTRMDSLLLGVLCAWAIRHGMEFSRRTLYLLLAALSLPLAVFILKNWTYAAQPMLSIGYSLLAAFYAVLLLLTLSEKQGPIAWVMRLPWLRQLGIYAYFIYLTHWIVAYLIFRAFGKLLVVRSASDAALLAGSLAVTLLVARLSWQWFEAPLIRFGSSGLRTEINRDAVTNQLGES
jgi:peptidoglycan/LPS O-acetylase OafA/YrhL